MNAHLRIVALAAGLLATQDLFAAEAAKPALPIAAAQARLSYDLIGRLSKDGGDALVSPSSLGMILAILGEGSADEAWKKAVAKIVQPEGKADFADILSARERLRAGYEAVQSADVLIFPPDAPPVAKLAESLAKKGVESAQKDLSKPDDVQWLNDKVKALTNGAIPDLLQQPLSAPGFAAINALHFKAKWRLTFDPQLTVPAPFYNADESKGEIKLMRAPVSEYGFRIEGQFVAAALPFADNRSELVLITTREKPAKAAEFKPVFSWLSGEGFESHKGDVALPRFALSGANELLPALDDLGLAEARKSQAPLSAFSPGAVLSQVLQRVTIEADEQGAEAAAATAVITTRSLGEDSSIHLVVDKPFLFALRDRESGLILVSGYVGHAPKGKGD